MRECGNLARCTPQPMIGHGAGEAKTMLHDVQAVHTIFRRAYTTPRRESADRFEIALTAIEKIVVQCKNDVSTIEFRQHPCVRTKSCLRRRARILTKTRLVHAPAHCGEFFL